MNTFVPTMDKILIYIADNQSLTRLGTIALLEQYLSKRLEIKEFSTKEHLFEQLAIEQPQVLIIDFDLFDFNGLDELLQINKLSPTTGVLIITEDQSPEDIIKVVGLGFSNYVLKSCQEQELIDAFNAVLASRKYFSNEILDVIIGQRSKTKLPAEPGKLTASEIEIVKLITQGLTTKEIALKKNLSFHTIITHRKNIFRKLLINNTSELMMYAMRTGIIDSLEYYI